MLSPTDIRKLHDLAVQTACEAGALIQSKVGRHGETRTKSGGDTLASQVVTDVDLQSEALIVEALRPSMADLEIGLLTEERADDASRFAHDRFWCIDPIDGTLPFTEGRPGYAVSIALVSRDGQSVLGVVHDPVAQVTYHAIAGQGAFSNSGPLRTAPRTPDPLLTWIMDRSTTEHTDFRNLAQIIEDMAARIGCTGVTRINHAGAALNGCLVARDAPGIYFKLPKKAQGGGSVWDFAATTCILSEAGGSATDIHGQSLDLNPAGSTFMNHCGVLYASDPDLATALITELAGMVPG